MSNGIPAPVAAPVVNEFFVFESAHVTDTIMGATAVSALNQSNAVASASGVANSITAGQGLASVLAMLAFGSMSYRTNPFESATTARGKALKSAFPLFAHVRAKSGKGISKADFVTWFDACVRITMSQLNSAGNPFLVPKEDKKPPAPKKPAPRVIADSEDATVEPWINVFDTDQAPRRITSAMKEETAGELAFINLIDDEEKAEAAAAKAREVAFNHKVATFAQRDKDNEARAVAFAELANSLGIKLSVAQRKALDAFSTMKRAA